MELLGRWTQDSRKDCDSIGLSTPGRAHMPPAVVSPDRRLGASVCLAIAMALIGTSGVALLAGLSSGFVIMRLARENLRAT